MSAILQRLHWGRKGDEMPVVQFLHREETLFVEPEWHWTRERAGAHIFTTHALAEAATKVHVEQHEFSGELRPFAVVCAAPDIKARGAREADRIATALSSIESPEALEPPRKAVGRTQRPQGKEAPAKRGVRQREATPEKEKVAITRAVNAGGVQAWKKVFERMEAGHPHEEVFEETERRTGS